MRFKEYLQSYKHQNQILYLHNIFRSIILLDLWRMFLEIVQVVSKGHFMNVLEKFDKCTETHLTNQLNDTSTMVYKQIFGIYSPTWVHQIASCPRPCYAYATHAAVVVWLGNNIQLVYYTSYISCSYISSISLGISLIVSYFNFFYCQRFLYLKPKLIMNTYIAPSWKIRCTGIHTTESKKSLPLPCDVTGW
jgi:hypothetical protein